MSEFKIPPISTLIGGTWSNFIATLRGNKIEPRHYIKILFTGLTIALCWPFRVYEHFALKNQLRNFKMKEDPVFILGHWRSGTTHLQAVLCQDMDASYLTTYYSVFPWFLKSKWLFKRIMRKKMPDTRPVDNLKLRPDAPQEDEFALSCLTPYSYYNFWLFPTKAREFYELYVRFNGSPDIKKEWAKKYEQLLKKANLETPGTRLVIKNPVNTARIPALLEIYPNAKFIYLYRNPFTVFLSSLRFFEAVFTSVWFHQITKKQIEQLVLETYTKLLNDYERTKGLVPEGNLVEIRFEDFEADPISVIRHIYQTLSLPGFAENRLRFEGYLRSLEDYRKNKYPITEAQVNVVKQHWGFALEKYNYLQPGQAHEPGEEFLKEI